MSSMWFDGQGLRRPELSTPTSVAAAAYFPQQKALSGSGGVGEALDMLSGQPVCLPACVRIGSRVDQVGVVPSDVLV